MIADTCDEDFAFHPPVRVVVDKKMKSLGYYYLFFEMVYLLFYLFSTFFIFTTAASVPNPLLYTMEIEYIPSNVACYISGVCCAGGLMLFLSARYLAW